MLLKMLNQAAAGTDLFSFSGGERDNEDLDHREESPNRRKGNAAYDFSTAQQMAAQFERNYADIQKLLDRAKNFDANPGSNNANMSQNPNTNEDKEKKKRQGVGATGAGGTTGPPVKEGMAFDMSTLDPSGGKPPLAGRKPLRVIISELARKIDQLKTNQAEWDVFQARIIEYRAAEKAKPAVSTAQILKANKEVLHQFLPEVRRDILNSLKETGEKHRKEVAIKKKQLETQKLRKKLEFMQKKEDVSEKGKKREKEEMGRAETLQRKWFIIVVVASRLHKIRTLLEDSHTKRMAYLRQYRACVVIQRAWRKYKEAVYKERVRTALEKISKIFHVYVRKRREGSRHKSSNIIRQFFRDIHDVSKLMKIVKKYRFSVIKAQKYCRNWSEVRNGQIQILCRYWDKVEPMWWANRKGGSNGDNNAGGQPLAAVKRGTASESTAALDAKTNGKGKKQAPQPNARSKKREEQEREKMAFLKVSETIKLSVIKDDLLRRRREHRKALMKYSERLFKYEQQRKSYFHKENEDSDTLPKRPFFKVFPPLPDMLALIEKGFLESANSTLGKR
ncbi:hypothetical protein BJ742DRAFT_765539 [Cladochytrium replicatum]|nr:hypothetical protein BJ742DRAFT_765539 [Cladochytrium replicatum]